MYISSVCFVDMSDEMQMDESPKVVLVRLHNPRRRFYWFYQKIDMPVPRDDQTTGRFGRGLVAQDIGFGKFRYKF